MLAQLVRRITLADADGIGLLRHRTDGRRRQPFRHLRFGAEVMRFRRAVRRDDVAGTVTYKMAMAVKRIYEQMAEPKWSSRWAPALRPAHVSQLRRAPGVITSPRGCLCRAVARRGRSAAGRSAQVAGQNRQEPIVGM